MKYKFFVALLVTLPSLAMAELYQWRDGDGALHISDKRPAFVTNVNVIKMAEPRTVPLKSLSKNSLIQRANNLPKRQPPVINPKPRRHKSQITIIKDEEETKPHVVSNNMIDNAGSNINVDFKKVTGFDNPDQLDIARIKCNSIQNSDCRTKTLMHLKLQEIQAKYKAKAETGEQAQTQIKTNRVVGKTLRFGHVPVNQE